MKSQSLKLFAIAFVLGLVTIFAAGSAVNAQTRSSFETSFDFHVGKEKLSAGKYELQRFVNDENGFANIWLLPLNGEKPKRITNFNDNFIFSFAWSPDGKRLAVSRGTLTSDAIIFKQN